MTYFLFGFNFQPQIPFIPMSIALHMERKWRSVAKDVAPCLEVLPWNNSLFLQFSTHRDHPLKNEVNQGTVTRGLILKVKRQM